MKARARWVEGMAFMGEAGSGHAAGPCPFPGGPHSNGRKPVNALWIAVALLVAGFACTTGWSAGVHAEARVDQALQRQDRADQHRDQQCADEVHDCGPRCTWNPANDCEVGISSMRLMLMCNGRLATQ